jgi:import receptor subunit TOM70
LYISFFQIEEFSEAVKNYPDCIEVYSLFAQILSDQQQYQLADEYFEKAMKLEPNNGEIVIDSCHGTNVLDKRIYSFVAGLYVHRGLLLLQWKGDINEALKLLEKSIEVDDKCEFAYETLGTVEVQRGMSSVSLPSKCVLIYSLILCRAQVIWKEQFRFSSTL